MGVEHDLKAWNGKSADDIREIYQQHRDAPGFEAEILELLRHGKLQAGATWLLKRHVVQAGGMAVDHAEMLYRSLDGLQDWEAKLHVLQCMAYVPVPESSKRDVRTFLLRGTENDRTFVRAWSYSGLHELAAQYPEYREETRRLLARAVQCESPSVKARIRKVAGEGS